MLECVSNSKDINFMYKVVSNNAVMKFPVTLRKDFNVEKDDMKFGFYMHVEYKISSS